MRGTRNRHRRIAVAVVALMAIISLAACGSSSKGSTGTTSVGSWTLESFTTKDGAIPAASTPATITFTDDGKVTGTTGCNTFGGSWSTAGTALNFAAIGMTSRACADPAVTAQETAFAVAFSKQQTFTMDGDTLTISATDGATSMTFVRTSSSASSTTTTVVATTTTVPAIPATPITIAHGQSATAPDGSGCSPAGDTLPDGLWFGILRSVDVPGNSFGLDLACLYTGAAADAESLRTGGEAPVPNGYLVSNQATKVFTVPAWPNIQVVPLEMEAYGPTGAMAPTSTGLGGATAMLGGNWRNLVWVKIVGGRAIVLQAMFTP